MDKRLRKDSFFPARCPGCEDVVHLLVRNSGQVTLHVHNTRGCNLTFYYRCWIEQGLPLPRVEFIDPQNAKHFTLHPHPADAATPTTVDPFPPPARSMSLSDDAGGRPSRAGAARTKTQTRQRRN